MLGWFKIFKTLKIISKNGINHHQTKIEDCISKFLEHGNSEKTLLGEKDDLKTICNFENRPTHRSRNKNTFFLFRFLSKNLHFYSAVLSRRPQKRPKFWSIIRKRIWHIRTSFLTLHPSTWTYIIVWVWFNSFFAIFLKTSSSFEWSSTNKAVVFIPRFKPRGGPVSVNLRAVRIFGEDFRWGFSVRIFGEEIASTWRDKISPKQADSVVKISGKCFSAEAYL